MRGRKPEKFQLKPRDKAYLRKLLRDGKTPWRIARREKSAGGLFERNVRTERLVHLAHLPTLSGW